MTDPLAGIAWSPIHHVEPGTLVVLDATRRLYAGLAREGDYWHVIQPTTPGDPASPLECGCKGSRFNGRCYMTTRAEGFEGRDALPWLTPTSPAVGLDNPTGAGDIVEAYRG